MTVQSTVFASVSCRIATHNWQLFHSRLHCSICSHHTHFHTHRGVAPSGHLQEACWDVVGLDRAFATLQRRYLPVRISHAIFRLFANHTTFWLRACWSLAGPLATRLRAHSFAWLLTRIALHAALWFAALGRAHWAIFGWASTLRANDGTRWASTHHAALLCVEAAATRLALRRVANRSADFVANGFGAFPCALRCALALLRLVHRLDGSAGAIRRARVAATFPALIARLANGNLRLPLRRLRVELQQRRLVGWLRQFLRA